MTAQKRIEEIEAGAAVEPTMALGNAWGRIEDATVMLGRAQGQHARREMRKLAAPAGDQAQAERASEMLLHGKDMALVAAMRRAGIPTADAALCAAVAEEACDGSRVIEMADGSVLIVTGAKARMLRTKKG